MKTILVAEDREVSRELIEAILTASGYRVVMAVDGQDALEQAARLRADLIILDLYMPRVDGFGVLRQLRADPNYLATPIIALTASAMAGDRERALAAGFSEYISKPVNIPLLRSEISRLLEVR
jgi:CheY-like chemotaxis protein